MNNPKQSAYSTLRDHAKARGLAFNLTRDYFLGMMDCAAAWDREAEKRGDIVTLDRKQAHLGYIMGNIQVVTLSFNTAKGNRERHMPAVVQAVLARKRCRGNGIDSHEEWQEKNGRPF